MTRSVRAVLLVLVTALAVSLPVAGASAVSPPTDVIYQTTNSGTGFARTNPSTGASTVLGSGSSGFSSMWAAAIDTDGTLWTIVNGFNTNGARVGSVNKTTGQVTLLPSPIGPPMISLEVGDDGDGTPDSQDAFPLDENEQIDTDGDGTGNNADTDDDNDGIPDSQDSNPTDPDNARPSNADQCKKDGWRRFMVDRKRFKNQGDCVSYVATKGKNQPAGR